MKKWKLNLFTLLHAYCEQKRENQDLKNLLRDKDATIRGLRVEKEAYRRGYNELKGYAELCTPITERIENYKNGWLE